MKYDLEPGFMIAGKYEVIDKLGSGWEGEVYRVKEKAIGVERAAKLFYPRADSRNRATKFYARKLHKLRHCPILIQYHTGERIAIDGEKVNVLISEYVEGEILASFVRRQPGRKLTPFEGLHLLHELSVGVEVIHRAREYHGDLHDDNIIIRRKGLSFNVKVVDMFNWGTPGAENYKDDVCDLIRIFYDCIGGKSTYWKQSPGIKYIVSGLKRSLITEKFRTAGHLRRYIETMEWE
jgi:serine/threonine protein kinase